jgi:hypothetical protein
MLLADLGLHSADESPAQEDPQHLAESTESPEHSALLFRSLYQSTLWPIRLDQSTPNIRVATVASSCEEERKPLIPRVSS